MAIKDEAGNWKEIVSLDVNNLEQAKKVWRWNNGGFGFSSTGYNGPYRLAITQDGAIVADFITTGTLTANIIKAGILKSLNGATEINMETGVAKLTGSLRTETRTSEGKTVYSNLDSGGLTIQRNADQIRGVYTGSNNDVLGNFDRFFVTKKESPSSPYGDAMIFAEHDGKDTVLKMFADTENRDLAVELKAYQNGNGEIVFYDENRMRTGIVGRSVSHRPTYVLGGSNVLEFDPQGDINLQVDKIKGLKANWEYDSEKGKMVLVGEV